MAKLVAAFRLFVAFVVGIIVGLVGTWAAIYSGHGTGDFFIAAAPQVKALQRGLEDVETQRDSMTRRLENLASVLERVEQRYADLSRRFESIEGSLRLQKPGTPAAPGSATPGSAAIP